MRDRVSDILDRHAPVDVEERAESWRHAGWTRFDESAEPYTSPAFPQAAPPRMSAGVSEPVTPARERLSPAVARRTAPIGGPGEPPAENLPETGGAADMRRDWAVRRDENRIRDDAGRRNAVRVYPRTEESIGDRR